MSVKLRAEAIDRFIKGLKEDGIYSDLQAACVMAGWDSLAGALTPLVGTAPTNVADGFVEGDYTRGGATPGLKGDGTSYLNVVGAYEGSPTQNSAHQALYLSETASTSPAGFMTHIAEKNSAGAGDGRTQITQTSTVTFTRCREGNGETLAQAPSTGFIGISRALVASYERRLSGSTATVLDVSDGIPDGDLFVFQNGGNGQFSNARLAFYSIGESLDLALLDARVTALVTAIGAAV